jgi:hypothetical protein
MARRNEMQTAEELRPGYKIEVSNLETHKKEYMCVCKFRDWINESINDSELPAGVQYWFSLDDSKKFRIQSYDDNGLDGAYFNIDELTKQFDIRGRTISFRGTSAAPEINISVIGLPEFASAAAAFSTLGVNQLYVNTTDYSIRITNPAAE